MSVIEKAIVGSEAIVRRSCKIGNGNNIGPLLFRTKEEIKSSSILDAIEA